MRIVCQKEMKKIEEVSQKKYDFTEDLIVEQVGLLGAQVIQKQLNSWSEDLEIIFLIGKGNNGADGLSIARHLSNQNRKIKAFLLFDEKDSTLECRKQLKRAALFGVRIYPIKEIEDLVSFFQQDAAPKVIVDAIFGTGVRLPLSQMLYDMIDFINDHSSYTISIDIPSGVEGDTGLVQGNAIRANLTLAVGFPKLGYYVSDGAHLIGDVSVLDVGFPNDACSAGDKFLLTKDNLSYKTHTRSKFADKKIFGHTLVLGGSHGLTGALVMASSAALKVGTGLVTAVTWESQYQEMMTRLIPEIMTGYVPNDQTKWPRLLKDINKYNSIVIGPGLARSIRSRHLVLEILNNFSGPVILDADAINVLNLKDDKDVFSMRASPTIMTPHFGEFARFTNLSVSDVSKRPVDYLKEVVNETHCAIILKGPCSYLGLTNGQVYFNYSPNDGMATGGVGDVLAGILGGIMAQNYDHQKLDTLEKRYHQIHNDILYGVYIHSLSGNIAAERLGVRAMTATSLIDSLSETFKRLDQQQPGEII